MEVSALGGRARPGLGMLGDTCVLAPGALLPEGPTPETRDER